MRSDFEDKLFSPFVSFRFEYGMDLGSLLQSCVNSRVRRTVKVGPLQNSQGAPATSVKTYWTTTTAELAIAISVAVGVSSSH